MFTFLRPLFFLASTVFVAGCVPMIPMYSIGDQRIERELTEEEIREGIIEGATNAGWHVQKQEAGRITLSLAVRAHLVVVEALYDSSNYRIDYVSSRSMKIQCEMGEPVRLSGAESCPDNKQPAYIHKNYRAWIENLNHSVLVALATV